MTRELKLALIVGFSLVLVVTVLISDHLSSARKASLDDTVAQQPHMTPKPPTEPPTDRSTGHADRLVSEPAGGRIGGPLAGDPMTPEAPAPEYRGMAKLDEGTSRNEAGSSPDKPVEFQQGRSTQGDNNDALFNELTRLGYQIRDGKIIPPAAKVEGSETPGGATSARTGQSEPPTSPDLIPITPSADKEYTVANGDLLYRIAKREYGDGELWRKLAAYNPGKVGPDGQLRVGSKLKLPPKDVLVGPAKTTPSKPQAAPGTTRLAKDTPVKSPESPRQASKTRSYTIKKGDTLGIIAMRELGTTKRANEILDLNRDLIKNPNSVPLGVTIRLPA